MLTVVLMSALIVSAGILSGPDDFPFFNVLIVLRISVFVGSPQFIGTSDSVSTGGMFGGVFEAVLFSSCSVFIPP
jgi:hypothetical protein